MAEFVDLPIGIVASLSGPGAQVGKGYRDSAAFMIERRQADFRRKGVALRLIEKDDAGDPETAVSMAKECVESDCVAILGPNDTLSMKRLLASGSCSVLPIISTIATASFLSEIGARNFFRFTTPDHVRTEILVRYVRRMHAQQTVFLYSFEGPQMSYSQQLKDDVVESLERYSCKWCADEFNDLEVPNSLPEKEQPIIVCAPSRNTALLAQELRNRNINSQIFTFGSNTNLLTSSLVGTVVVCDLDRNDSNPLARDELDHFFERHKNTSDPSLSTMNAMAALLNILNDVANHLRALETPQLRYELINHFRSKPVQGILGPIAFSGNGEMAGNEQISVLRVARIRTGLGFAHMKIDEKPIRPESGWWSRKVVLWLSVIGSLASIVSLVLIFG